MNSNRILRMSYLAAGVGGIGFFCLSVLVLGVWPGAELEDQMQRMSPETTLPLSASEQRGRLIYAREGCAYCHTQQIRHTEADVARFGAPVLAWETQLDYPHLWGTRRIGPDLSREAGVRSEDWQLTHLYDPRAVVSESVMPAYPSMFNGAPDQPTQEGRDLLAYLETLGRARELAGPEGEARAREACNCPADREAMEFDGPLNAHASKQMPEEDAEAQTEAFPELAVEDSIFDLVTLARGADLFARNCAGCHGAGGEGDGLAAAGLHPAPANLTQHRYSDEEMVVTLWAGVEGTAMPAWRELPQDDLAALATFVLSLSPGPDDAPMAEELLTQGAEVYSARCAQCHGDDGAGDGFASESFAIHPTNFHAVQPSMAASLTALRQGVNGTRMARWEGELTDAELTAVAAYVREFFEAEEAGDEQ